MGGAEGTKLDHDFMDMETVIAENELEKSHEPSLEHNSFVV